MSDAAPDFWTDETSVLLTSFWGWSPETWGTVGWTGDRGLARRTNLLNALTNPFITVCYATSNKSNTDPALKGMIAGFYLVSHETCDRDDYSHPIHYDRFPEKWRHSLRSMRAFSYLPEHRLTIAAFDPTLLKRARAVASMGEVLTDPIQITLLRETPWKEVPIYTPKAPVLQQDTNPIRRGYVAAGPASEDGYEVFAGSLRLKRQLYVLRLDGDTDAYLGRNADGRAIYKIGLSVSPDLRRQAFQKSMPRGSFNWCVERATTTSDNEKCFAFYAAVAGEDAIKKYLAQCSEWLGGEFYLATEAQIDEAWRRGLAAARSQQ